MDPGLEIIIETDVVPQGTVDLAALTAAPGTPRPNVKVSPDGRVTRLQPDEVSSLLTSDVVAEVRQAARQAESGKMERVDVVDSNAITHADLRDAAAALQTEVSESKAPTVPPPGMAIPTGIPGLKASGEVPLPDFDELEADAADVAPDFDPTEAEFEPDPSLDALDAAANAPMPARPASAHFPRAREELAAQPEQPEPEFSPFLGEDPFETSIGSRATLAWEATRLLGVMLVLTAGLIGLYVYLRGPDTDPDLAVVEPDTETPPKVDVQTPPDDKTPEDTNVEESTPEDTNVEESTPEDTTPEDTTPEDTTPEDTTPEDTTPEDTTPEDTAPEGPTPEEVKAAELEALRQIAGEAGTGGEVGTEEDTPGLLARIERLRADAARLLAEGGHEAALELLRELIKLTPADADVLVRLGTTLHHLGRLGEAEDHYRKAVEQAPDDHRPWNNLSVIQLGQGKADAARRSLEKAFQLAPENPAVLTNLANQLDSPAQSHPLYDKALTIDPDHGQARLGRARARERLGDVKGARADYKFLIEANNGLRPEAYDGMGRISSKAGLYERAIAYHRKAFEVRGEKLPGAQIDLGKALLDAGHHQKAIQVLQQAVRDQSESMRAWQALGIAFSRASEDRPYYLMKAKKAYEKAIKLGKHWLNHYNYALCAERFGNFPVAILHYEKAIAADSRAWQAYANLARLYERADRPEKALEFVDRALATNPEEGELHLHRAHLLAAQGQEQQARAAMLRFVGLARPGDPRVDKINAGLDGGGGN